MRSQADADSMVALEVFGEAAGSVDPAERPFDDRALGATMNPLICLSW